MCWAAEQEGELNDYDRAAHGNLLPDERLDMAHGDTADASDQYEELASHNSQLCNILRALTKCTPSTYVDNSPPGNGLEAWIYLHAKCDPATGGRKKAMLNALIWPTRSDYDKQAGALER